jgi:hypothetical protein
MFSKEGYQYTMSSYIKNDAWEDHRWAVIGAHEDAIKLINLYTTSANIHRKSEGTAMRTESAILIELEQLAKGFLDAVNNKRKEFKRRIRHHKKYIRNPPPAVLCLKSTKCPEIIVQKTMCYLSPIVRLENLRHKYTDEFILAGLARKKVPQLKFIFTNYYQALSTHFTRIQHPNPETSWEYDYNQQIKTRLVAINNFWGLETIKSQKIKVIFRIYLHAEEILYHSLIDWSLYDTHCQGVINLLHLLVLAIRTPKKNNK